MKDGMGKLGLKCVTNHPPHFALVIDDQNLHKPLVSVLFN